MTSSKREPNRGGAGQRPPFAQRTRRKSDVSDCEWLREFHSVGLLSASFRPAAEIVALRTYLRQRASLVEESTSHIQRMQKALTQMNLMLHVVLSDITGATGLKIVRSIVDGERDGSVLI